MADYSLPKKCAKSSDGHHDIVAGAVAEYCRYCWVVPRYVADDISEPVSYEHKKRAPKVQSQPPGPPGKSAKKLRMLTLIYARDGRRCWWCGRVLLAIDEVPVLGGQCPPGGYPTLDHLLPVSKGGRTVITNLVASCPACNSRRGNAVARYVPVDSSVELHATTTCPDCTKGVWAEGDGRVCPTCEGAGELTAARAVTLFQKQRDRARSEQNQRVKARTEVGRLRRIVEGELGEGSTRRGMAEGLRKQRATIAALADRVLALKVELALVTGRDLHKMVPFPSEYERALRLATQHTAQAEHYERRKAGA